MKKLNFLEKLSKNELKQIKAGEGGTRSSGGSNNSGAGGNDDCLACGLEPDTCYSSAWYNWHSCMVTCKNGALPFTQCH